MPVDIEKILNDNIEYIADHLNRKVNETAVLCISRYFKKKFYVI